MLVGRADLEKAFFSRFLAFLSHLILLYVSLLVLHQEENYHIDKEEDGENGEDGDKQYEGGSQLLLLLLLTLLVV